MTMRRAHRHGRAVLAGAALMACLASAAFATTPKPAAPASKRDAAAPAPKVVTAAPAPGSIGLMAFLDPDTGLLTGPIGSLVPPADQRAAAANVVLQAMQRPNGAWLLDLKGTMLDYYVVHVDAFGRRTVSCAQDPSHVHRPAPLPPAPVAAER